MECAVERIPQIRWVKYTASSFSFKHFQSRETTVLLFWHPVTMLLSITASISRKPLILVTGLMTTFRLDHSSQVIS